MRRLRLVRKRHSNCPSFPCPSAALTCSPRSLAHLASLTGALKVLRELFGVARANLVLQDLCRTTTRSELPLLFAEFTSKTVPANQLFAPQANEKPYFLVSTRLLQHAQTLAQQPRAVPRVSAQLAVQREDQMHRLVMASAAHGPLMAIAGIELPDLSALVTEASRRQNGAALLNTLLGSLLDVYDLIKTHMEASSLAQLLQESASLQRAVAAIADAHRELLQADEVAEEEAEESEAEAAEEEGAAEEAAEEEAAAEEAAAEEAAAEEEEAEMEEEEAANAEPEEDAQARRAQLPAFGATTDYHADKLLEEDGATSSSRQPPDVEARAVVHMIVNERRVRAAITNVDVELESFDVEAEGATISVSLRGPCVGIALQAVRHWWCMRGTLLCARG